MLKFDRSIYEKAINTSEAHFVEDEFGINEFVDAMRQKPSPTFNLSACQFMNHFRKDVNTSK